MKRLILYLLLLSSFAGLAQQTDASLTTQADVIRNETAPGGNTKARIADMYQSIIDSKFSLVPWVTATSYTANKSSVIESNILYKCIVTHTSGTFATDLAASRWIAISNSGSGGDWGDIGGALSDQTDLQSELDDKGDALVTANSVTGAHTLDATDLAIVNAGGQLDVQGDNTGALTIPLNSSVAFPVGSSLSASGFTGSVIATGGVTITGTRGDLVFPSGSSVFLQKTATNTWTLNNGLPDASLTVKGLVELATDAETITGIDAVRATTPAGVAAAIAAAGSGVSSVFSRTGAVVATSGDYTATQITNTPAGNIAATNVQTALNELDTEKGNALTANPLSQFAATTSLQLAGVLSDETGTGSSVFSASPALTGTPTAPTQTAGDNSTKIATTAYVDALIMPAFSTSANGYTTSSGASGNWLLGNNTWFTPGSGVQAFVVTPSWTNFNSMITGTVPYYTTLGGGTATGNNVYTHTGFTRKFIWDGLTTTHTNGYGHWIANTTAAAAGVQQQSPSIVWEGQGWKTNATAASQSVMAKATLLPIQGAANPTSSLNFAFSTNGAAYSSDVFQIRSGLTVPIICDGVGFSITNGGISLSSAAPITNTLVFNTNGTISSAGLIMSSGNGGVTLGASMSYVYSPASGSVSATTLGVATNFAPTSVYSGGTFRSVLVNPTYNNVGTNTAIGIDFNPTRTNVTGLTEYGILIRPTAAKSGFGIAAPTATMHVVGSTILDGANTFTGTTTNDAAASGIIGEEVNGIVSTYTDFTTTATYQNITSITLTAGDWDLSGFFTYSSNSATITAASNAIFVISTTTASAAGATEGRNIAYVPQAALLGTSLFSDSIAPYRVSISGTTTFYLNAQATFTLGNPQYVGGLRARRIR
jgi:hypothetical protein